MAYKEREIEKVPYPHGSRWLLEISFDGANYGGWQIQENSLTVQMVIEQILSRLYGYIPIKLTGSSRTDAGVHAINFAASFLAPLQPAIPPQKLKQALNRLLPKDIRIRTITEVDVKFHARFDALGKAYTYVINTGDETPFSNHYSLHPKFSLDPQKIIEAKDILVGTHDFSSFVCCRNAIDDAVRTIYRIELHQIGQYLCITYVGNGFLYKMIRCLTGAFIQIGSNRLSKEELKELLEAKDRTLAPATASASGLFLMKVFYDFKSLEDYQTTKVPFFI